MSSSGESEFHQDVSMLDEADDFMTHDDNVDWITVRQLVFGRLSFMFSAERIQEAMESTRKPNSNDWIRAAATKIASEWQQLLDSPPSHVFPLVALPVDLLKRIFNQFCPTRDMMALGLVSQQFRRCVNWNKHYLTLDCSSRRLENFTLNGCRISLKRWPHLVELLLDKTVIASFSVKAPSVKSKTFGLINEIMEQCIRRPDRFRLESVTVLNPNSESFFCLAYDHGICSNLRFITISGTCLMTSTESDAEETERLGDILKEKPLESIELNLRKKAETKETLPRNVNITKICTRIQPHTLRILKTDSPEHSLLEFVRKVPTNIISCLKTLSYIGENAIVNYTEINETIELLWQASPYLEYCKLCVERLMPCPQAHYATTAEIVYMIQNIFVCIFSHSKTTEFQPINIVLCATLDKPLSASYLTYTRLSIHSCQKDDVLSILQEYDPETHIVEDVGTEDGIFDEEFVGTYTIKRGRIFITVERTRCGGYDAAACQLCKTDYRMLLRAVIRRFYLARRRSNVPHKLVYWYLNRCQTDQLIEDLRKKFDDVKLELMRRKRKVDRSYFPRCYMISLADDNITIEATRCSNGQCNVCH